MTILSFTKRFLAIAALACTVAAAAIGIASALKRRPVRSLVEDKLHLEAAASHPSWLEPVAHRGETPHFAMRRCGNSANELVVGHAADGIEIEPFRGWAERHGPEAPRLTSAALALASGSGVAVAPAAVARTADGWLLGFSAGEWGGSLWHVPDEDDSSRARKLSDGNVREIFVDVDKKRALVLTGLAHIDEDQGSLLEMTSEGGWTIKSERLLRGAARFALEEANRDLLVLAGDSLVRFERRTLASRVLATVPTGGLYARSAAVDRDGALWIGMRYFVVRVDLAEEESSVQWYAPRDGARSLLPGSKRMRCHP